METISHGESGSQQGRLGYNWGPVPPERSGAPTVPVPSAPQASYWVAIATSLCSMITDGTYPPDSRVPAVRQLAASWQVSLSPVRRAYLHLEAVGVLKGIQRQGVWVQRLPEPGDLPGGVVPDDLAAVRRDLLAMKSPVSCG